MAGRSFGMHASAVGCVTVGWDFGTPAYRPFFFAQVEDLAENY